ncbi:hypothetical protein K8R66_03805 [bacterium]|nr:hypothetical protein [bacterium]
MKKIIIFIYGKEKKVEGVYRGIKVGFPEYELIRIHHPDQAQNLIKNNQIALIISDTIFSDTRRMKKDLTRGLEWYKKSRLKNASFSVIFFTILPRDNNHIQEFIKKDFNENKDHFFQRNLGEDSVNKKFIVLISRALSYKKKASEQFNNFIKLFKKK